MVSKKRLIAGAVVALLAVNTIKRTMRERDGQKKEEIAFTLAQKQKAEQEGFERAKAGFIKKNPDLVKLNTELKNENIISKEIDYESGTVIIEAKVSCDGGWKELNYHVRKTEDGDYSIEVEGQQYFNDERPSESIEDKGILPAGNDIVKTMYRLCSTPTGGRSVDEME